MAEPERQPRRARAGGRAARVAARAAPLPVDIKPIRPGMPGGAYAPLTDAEVQRVHARALEALETIGLADAPPSGVEILTGAGAIQGEDGRIRFPRALVEDMLAVANKDLTLHGRDPEFDLPIRPGCVHYGTAGAAVSFVDLVEGGYRDARIADLHEAACITQALDNIHFFQRVLVARDILDMQELDINTLYASISGTVKHVGTAFSDPSCVAACFELLHMVAGSEAAWRARPFVSNSNCFVVPPMKFATESCQTMEHCVREGMPVLLLSAGQAGATAPASIALAIVQAVAECLAGVVYVNAMQPGAPAIFGTWPFVSDLRTGAMSGGSAEQALLSAGCAQMHRFYGVPGGAAAGMTDAKLPDMQAGWEQGITATLAGLAGLNLVYESAGMHASLLGFCPESLILGDDLVGQALRTIKGIDMSEDALSLDPMRMVCLEGPGHYLGSDQTLHLMQRDYVYPRLGDRMSPNEWEQTGRETLLSRAAARRTEIMAEARPRISADLDQAVRARFEIKF